MRLALASSVGLASLQISPELSAVLVALVNAMTAALWAYARRKSGPRPRRKKKLAGEPASAENGQR